MDGGNEVSVTPTAPAAPLLDYLQVKTAVPSPPPAPTGLTVEPTGSHSIYLTWKPVPGASTYNVTRSSGTPAAMSYTAVGVTGTSYTDGDILIGGSTWYYAVQAVNQGGGGGTTQAVGTTTPVDSPSGLQVSGQPNANVLTWMSANGAASYNVLRGSASGGPYTLLASVKNAAGSSQSYSDSTATPNAVAYYVVQTVNSSGNPSLYSYEVKALTPPKRGTITVNLSAKSLTLLPGTGDSLAVSLSYGSGVSGAARFSATGLPANVDIAFTPANSSSGTTFVVYVQPSAAPGSYSLHVNATVGSVVGSAALTLIVPKHQTINFPAIGPQTVGTPLKLRASASSGLDVSFTSATGKVCTTTGATAVFLSAGTCTITASQPGNGVYTAAPSITQSFKVVVAPPSFTLTPGATVLNLQQNEGTTDAITVTASKGFSGSVKFSATGVPTGTSSTFEGDTFVLYVGTSTPTGHYPITITGVSGTVSASTTITLTVTAARSFTIAPATTSVTVKPGTSGSDTLTIKGTNGFAGTVSFTASGLPAGATAKFSPASAGSTSTVTLTAGTRAAAGSYPITITGTTPGTATSQSTTASTKITLVIT
jgi:hypothetical protein